MICSMPFKQKQNRQWRGRLLRLRGRLWRCSRIHKYGIYILYKPTIENIMVVYCKFLINIKNSQFFYQGANPILKLYYSHSKTNLLMV
jgi:hypothetical protein